MTDSKNKIRSSKVLKKSGVQPILPHAKLLKLFKIMADLKSGRWKVKDLASRYNTTTRTIYRYITLLDKVDIPVERGFDNRYFIALPSDGMKEAEFNLEERKLIQKLIQTELDDNPLKEGIIQKTNLSTDLAQIPTIIVKARRGKFVEQLSKALNGKRQVILKSYHSANSRAIADRLIEPIEFGDNYQNIKAFDVKDKKCKQFKLERISEVILLSDCFKYEKNHVKSPTDIFGMTGNEVVHITLHMKMRAYLLLREEFPLSIPFVAQLDAENYTFHGPVHTFEGPCRFVLGLLDEVKIIQPNDFRRFVQAKFENQTVLEQ